MALHIFYGYAFFHAFYNITDHVFIRIDINTGNGCIPHIFNHAVEISDDHIQFVLGCQLPVLYGERSLPFIQIHRGREVSPLLLELTDALGEPVADKKLFQGMAVLNKIHTDSGEFQVFIQHNLLEQNVVGVLHTDVEIIHHSVGCLLAKGIYGFHGGNTADKKSFKIIFDFQINIFKLVQSIISEVFYGDIFADSREMIIIMLVIVLFQQQCNSVSHKFSPLIYNNSKSAGHISIVLLQSDHKYTGWPQSPGCRREGQVLPFRICAPERLQ